jgi:hypothetical protein
MHVPTHQPIPPPVKSLPPPKKAPVQMKDSDYNDEFDFDTDEKPVPTPVQKHVPGPVQKPVEKPVQKQPVPQT